MRSKLIALRKEKGFTRKSIAEELNITESFYGKIERGNRNPTLDLAKSISKVLGDCVGAKQYRSFALELVEWIKAGRTDG